MRKSKIYILFLLIVLLISISPFFEFQSSYTYSIAKNVPKPSNFWVMGPLHIDDTGGGDYTWAEAALEDWCSGDGSFNNPYILENITIDANWLDNCILIEDSNNKYFTIRNCTVINSGTLFQAHAGIELLRSSNGTIEDNICLNNLKWGIYLQTDCYNNTVQNNYIQNSSAAGIRVFESTHNIIFNNTILEGGPNDSDGITVDFNSEFNTIMNNTITSHDYGIYIAVSSHNNTVISNKINGVNETGIYCYTDNCIIKMNKVNGSLRGIWLSGDDSIIYGNRLTNNNENGRDNGNNNVWYNGTLGNYWDDYTGFDWDEDGIGNTPYDIPGSSNSRDYYPIWDIGLDPIYIIGDATGVGAHNWTWASNQPWCTGSGTVNDPYTIKELVINDGGTGGCIWIKNSNVFFQILNCTLRNGGNSGYEILLNNTNNGIIRNNTCQQGYCGIFLTSNSDHNNISENIVINGYRRGICVSSYSDYNNIVDNIIIESYVGILVTASCHDNVIEENYADGNNIAGIYLSSNCTENLILKNDIINSTSCDNGIVIVYNCDNNKFYQNYIANNWRGIYMYDGCDDNIFWDNEFIDLRDYGLWIRNLTSPSSGNIIFGNTFSTRGQNGNDGCFGNYWYNGTTGNYWADYNGVDANDDRRGDIPYNITGDGNRQDLYPIWDDGDDVNPTLSVISPSAGSIFGANPPTCDLDIVDTYLNTTWYTLNNSFTTFFPGSNGVNVVPIDEVTWNSFSDGSILMTFYVNDSAGHPASISFVIIKDITNPSIIVNSPLGGMTFGADAPEFNVTIYDLHLQDAWYTIGSSSTIYSFTPINGINIFPIDESSWDALAEGDITINIFVNDSAGNTHSIQVIVNRDLPSGGGNIPFGNYHLIFLGLGIVSLLIIEIKKKNK
ncbi:MAG: nitrous oxide reductase family maturation protein NosD [Promethearchaeota archaeon]